MKDWIMEHKITLIAAVLIGLFGLFYFFTNNSNAAPTVQSVEVESKPLEGEKSKEEEPKEQVKKVTMMVDVKGQVKQPGVYLASDGERVIDLISRAGGLTEQAEQNQVNFSAYVQDEMVIYIPAKGEEGGPISSTSPIAGHSASGSANQEGKININKADSNELQNLPGIGPSKAAAIIEYRETNGPFKAAEDLKNISGIGDKTFEKLKGMVLVH